MSGASTAIAAMRLRLIGLLFALVGGAVVAIGAHAIGAFERAVAPELAKRTRLIGTIVRTELQRALELGVSLESITGLDRYLSDTLDKFVEVERIAVRTVDGRPVAVAVRADAEGRAMEPPVAAAGESHVLAVLEGNRLVGEIEVDINPTFVRTRLRDVFLDVMTIVLVATLVAVELILALTAASVARPLDRVMRLLEQQSTADFRHRIRPGGLGALARAADRLNDHAQDLAHRLARLPGDLRAQLAASTGARIADGRPRLLRISDIADIRLPLFLYAIATEIAVAFLPVYAKAMDRPRWLTAEVAAAAPLVFYLIAVAALTPFAARLSAYFGARRLFLLSIVPTIVSLAGLSFATHVVEVTLWRTAMALAYAAATIACQEYALRAAADRGSARPVGAFVAVVYGGVFCGAALGGVIAGRFGFAAALLTGAAIAAGAGVLGTTVMRGDAGDAAPERPAIPSRAGARWNRELIALLFGLAVPMNAATAVLVWYLTPLMLSAGGSNPAEIARVVMLYYLAVVLLGPAVTTLADAGAGPRVLTTSGAFLAGLALLAVPAWSGFWGVVVAIAGLGIGHTAMRAPMYAIAQRLDQTGGAIGPLRVFERLGAIAGLAACALALPMFGAAAMILALASVCLSGAAIYLLVQLTAAGSETR